MSVFSSFSGYGFIHHKALNTRSALGAAMTIVAKHPARTQVLEGDLCWDFSNDRQLFYFRHPRIGLDTLSASRITEGLGNKTLLGLEDLLPIKATGAFVVIELKVGRGAWRAAISRLIDFMEMHFAGRYWIDGFCLPMLNYVKQINRAVSVSLHTELVLGDYALLVAPQWPMLGLCRLDRLASIDAIAVRRHGTARFMGKACAAVRRANKALLLSRIYDLREFERSKNWGAVGGYVHWEFDELFKFNDEIDAKASQSQMGIT